jgi:hypothetical protein
VGWLWNLRSEWTTRRPPYPPISRRTPAQKLPRRPGPDPPGAHSRVKTQDITTEGQQPSSRRGTPARRLGLETTARPACLLPAKHLTCLTQCKGVRLGWALGPQGATPTHGRCSRNGSPRRGRCHPRAPQIDLDETLQLGDSDWRLPPDQPIYPQSIASAA